MLASKLAPDRGLVTIVDPFRCPLTNLGGKVDLRTVEVNYGRHVTVVDSRSTGSLDLVKKF